MSSLQRIMIKYKAREYSGRGMMGTTCLGFETDNIGEFFSCIIKELADLTLIKPIQELKLIQLEIAYAIKDFKFDSLGYGWIVYFPTLTYLKNIEE